MKLIGAGQPRTATTTQMIALEMLGLPCYHMRDMMSDPDERPAVAQGLRGRRRLGGDLRRQGVDRRLACGLALPELMDVYPDAKVLLSVRSADGWVKSMENTITQIFFRDTLMHHLARAQYNIDPNYAAWIDLLTEMNFGDERGV